ncbi:MAG: serine/threonine-protein kinase [Thermoanaerobaculia bacterium]|jgi:serine/threonine protein kinase
MWISDDAITRLRALPELPDFSDTRYRLIGELDRGGMGVVYAAEDVALRREVAIKVLRDGLLRSDAADRLEREAKILAAIEHPGIVPVHDTGTLPDGRAWYVMKRVRGARVDEIARAGLSRAEALRMFTRICEPVAFAHARGIVHRDLKPENVMIGEFGEVLVMDWGVAKLLRDTEPSSGREPAGAVTSPTVSLLGRSAIDRPLTSDGDVIGTRGYMAPEQERGDTGAISPRTDVWALGAILRDLVSAAAAREGIRLPRPLAAIIATATADEPDRRYASAVELAADVVRFADGNRVSAYREPPWERAARWLRKNRAAVAVVLAYLVMRTVSYLWFGR